MQVERLGVVMLPALLYFIYRRWYLNQTELHLLIVNCVLMLALAIGGWISQLAYLCGIGYHHLLVFQAARSTNLFRRHKSGQVFSACTQRFFSTNQNEFKLMLYLVYFWIVIKITSLKSIAFQMGGGTFVTVLAGWNCTLAQFWAINLIWLVLALGAAWACYFLIRHDEEHDTFYKHYLLKYKVWCDVAISCFVVAYNLWAYQGCRSLGACLVMYKSGWWARCIWLWGFTASTLVFFWKKQGVFEEMGSEKAEMENDMEKKLNEIEVNRQFSQLSVVNNHYK